MYSTVFVEEESGVRDSPIKIQFGITFFRELARKAPVEKEKRLLKRMQRNTKERSEYLSARSTASKSSPRRTTSFPQKLEQKLPITRPTRVRERQVVSLEVSREVRIP